jgi:hypothetical protein
MKLAIPVSIYDKATGHILEQFHVYDLVAAHAELQPGHGLYVPIQVDGAINGAEPSNVDADLFYLPNGVLTPRQTFNIKFHTGAEQTDFGIEFPEIDLNWMAIFPQVDAVNPGVISLAVGLPVYVSNVPVGTLVKVPGQPLFVSSGGEFTFVPGHGQDKLLFQHPAYKPWQIQQSAS